MEGIVIVIGVVVLAEVLSATEFVVVCRTSNNRCGSSKSNMCSSSSSS